MHACEALLAAFEATQDTFCLMRTTAGRIGHPPPGGADPRPDLGALPDRLDGRLGPQPRHDDSNIYRPWGFQPGHLVEWAKLLLTLERSTPGLTEADPDNWMVHRARELFGESCTTAGTATTAAWSTALRRMARPPPTPTSTCDPHKYHWVQNETLAAAAVLAERTHDAVTGTGTTAFEPVSRTHFVDHEHGAWFRILGADNR
ncbi:MAG: AGE family epimerase/isomerase [Burkholderiales bacterium]|nr:AGE family epimerase/isomerase [Burkholderiales bacterium]